MVRDFIGVMNEVMLETCDVFKVSSSSELIWNFHNESGNAKWSNIISLKDFEYQVFEVWNVYSNKPKRDGRGRKLFSYENSPKHAQARNHLFCM